MTREAGTRRSGRRLAFRLPIAWGLLWVLLTFLLVAVAGCAAKSRLLSRQYGPSGLEVETWRLKDGTCERRVFIGPYFYRGTVECPPIPRVR